jgi:hypothetical protein
MAPNVVSNAPKRKLSKKNITAGKKTHTLKNLILSGYASRQVIYLAVTVPGKHHDKKMADEANIVYPPHATLGKDTGFQGYEPPDIHAWQPRKKSRGQDLTVADRFVNKCLASVRIRVEHTLAGVKRSRIVKDVFRNTKPGLSDTVMVVACALHNLRMSLRHPIPAFTIFALLE